MSNLETNSVEERCESHPDGGGIQVLGAREVPLGGPRAMPVRRTLPQRERSLIGAWCFADHYGPDDVGTTGGMNVPPHPHTGLQTVSWLFTGEIEHRDSIGSHAMVRPGELNLMTAGRGIAHSEVSTPQTRILHGAQLWVALPASAQDAEPAFETYAPDPVVRDGATVRVFLGTTAGSTSPVRTFTPLLGAEVLLEPGAAVTLDIERGFEVGVLVDEGEVQLRGTTLRWSELGYQPPGESLVVLRNPGTTRARLLLLGGAPLGEQVIMWWNFLGRSHEDIVGYRREWQSELRAAVPDDPRFGTVAGYDGDPLPAPELPNSRLKPRG
ncbi:MULTISPECIES: pirin family protein [unclassified Rhodococcus (in: high G+C Gram-positive bacteria)]|uniref:pirin family protein n=1 Tax=unclassified Rhodococcus (in: high G+C Gram-positive bacteria) TaxID=192944 RepID=UPI001639B4DC|nr:MULTISPECIES: pirin family protein [unclassified Rhodococcus (in: high G+C Gram-positive bacteria)]MBC2639313.1 pirin family protein [Rhodococcus sp. 3A]MBC2895942.1 pirin family protein [Rhodococcus sp. 4CII]